MTDEQQQLVRGSRLLSGANCKLTPMRSISQKLLFVFISLLPYCGSICSDWCQLPTSVVPEYFSRIAIKIQFH